MAAASPRLAGNRETSSEWDELQNNICTITLCVVSSVCHFSQTSVQIYLGGVLWPDRVLAVDEPCSPSAGAPAGVGKLPWIILCWTSRNKRQKLFQFSNHTGTGVPSPAPTILPDFRISHISTVMENTPTLQQPCSPVPIEKWTHSVCQLGKALPGGKPVSRSSLKSMSGFEATREEFGASFQAVQEWALGRATTSSGQGGRSQLDSGGSPAREGDAAAPGHRSHRTPQQSPARRKSLHLLHICSALLSHSNLPFHSWVH